MSKDYALRLLGILPRDREAHAAARSDKRAKRRDKKNGKRLTREEREAKMANLQRMAAGDGN